ncbi:glycogen/starch/alpha-glucan phosphorylase [Dongia sedimenti]|uniref:Alpha-1,4 glucan phosphorylase n=1 Tax=Dongia sedimenti TaxID=3064282 RepID=A0ABU0YS60_9PROT|nr:glycogen/starch/alpha-glucan phosphorylase [Rhodospirillaceae bacterium R-7]
MNRPVEIQQTRRDERTEPESEVATLKNAIESKLLYTVGKDPAHASVHDWYMATALAVRDRMVDRWVETTRRTYAQSEKRVYYLSLEFLIGRLLIDSLTNLGLIGPCRTALHELGVDFDAVRNSEPDAALGNGGLGRLAACYLEAMASTGIAGFGYGIRYDHGLFRQIIRDGNQVEVPEDWLAFGNPWEFERPEVTFNIGLGGRVEPKGPGGQRFEWRPSEYVVAVAYDTPVVGWEGKRVNTLRLWSARPAAPMQFTDFNRGQYQDAFAEQVRASSISRVLYPDDSTPAGQELRLKQEYFFVSASLQDLVRRHVMQHGTVANLPKSVAMQLNDTHPALAVAELVRILIDEHKFVLRTALELTRATIAYTNHTLLPEALETWPVALMERLLPRHMQIIYQINALHLAEVAERKEISPDRVPALSLIDEHGGRRVKMGHLAFVGSHRVNGVSGLHGKLMRESVFRELHQLHPERITHITNGVTFRRWLLECNRGLADLISEAIGAAWIGDSTELERLMPLRNDAVFPDRFLEVKRRNKERLIGSVLRHLGVVLSPDSLFDVQVKRMHEYKRQLLNILEAVAHYNEIRAAPHKDWVPRVKIFAGKAAASYHRAKLIIKLINDVARIVNNDPIARDKLRILFLPNYNVSLAELVMPAADLSEQISTAGMEASGTGNMKFALNGALTIGTFDGANIEIHDHVGPDNIMIFGLRADEVAARHRAGYAPGQIVAATPALAETLAAIRGGVFSPEDPQRYVGLVDDLVSNDHFLVTADFAAYAAKQREVDALFQQRSVWAGKAITNTAKMGWFSADRAIREYAAEIWGARAED